MNTNYKSISIQVLTGLALSVFLVGCSTFADGRKGKHGHGGMGEHKIKMMQKHLDLTEEQTAEVEKIHKSSEQAKKAKKSEIEKTREELRALMDEEPINKRKVRAKLDQMAKLKVEKRMLWIEDKIQVQKILTPEQKSKQKELKKKMREKMKKRCKHE